MVAKPAVYRNREKFGTKQPFLQLLWAIILGVRVALWSAVVLIVRIGGVYGVTTYTGNLSSDFRILDFFLSTYTGWSKNLFPNKLTKSY